MNRSIAATLLAALLVAVPLSSAGATIYCDIRETADGFVALRSGPSAGAGIIEKMRPGDEILVGVRKVGRWIEVTFWRGGRFASGRHETGDPPTARGWMHRPSSRKTAAADADPEAAAQATARRPAAIAASSRAS